ncbi:hypothetical protein Dimus_016292 [Dionaea muscipula]
MRFQGRMSLKKAKLWSEEAAAKDAQTVETAAVSVVSEKKRHLKKVTDTGEREGPVGAGGEKRDGSDLEGEMVETTMDAPSLSATNLNKDMDDLIFEAVQHSFIIDVVISLDALVYEQREIDPSGLLYTPVGLDGGMSQLLGQTEGIEEPKMSEMVEEVGKGVVVIEEEGGKDEMEENDRNKEGVSPSVARRPSA